MTEHVNPSAAQPPESGFHLMLEQNTFIDYIGPVWQRIEGATATTLLLVEQRHTNPNGTVHGGILMSLMDVTLGSSVHGALMVATGEPRKGHPITMQMSSNLIGGSAIGEWLRAEATADRTTKNVGFTSGRITTGDRLLMTATGVFKNPPLVKPQAKPKD